MKHTKKISIVFFMFLLLLPTVAFGEEKADEVLYQNHEEKDLNKLFEKAKNKVSEVDLSNIPVATNPGEVSTAQILNVRTQGDEVLQDIALTTFAIDGTVTSANGDFTTLATLTQSDSENDSTISYKSYSTIYFTKNTKNGIDYYKLTRATGGWTRLDSSVTIAKRLVRLGCTNYFKTQTKDYTTITTNTFDISTPSTWVEITGAGAVLGATMETTYQRNTSTWKHVFINSFTP